MSQGCCGEFDGLKNPARFRIVESHFSQRTREMGHPAQGGKSETSPTTDRCVSNDCLRLLHCAAIAAGSVRAFRTAISLAGHCVSLPIPLWISGAMAAHWSALSLLPPCCLCLRGFVKGIMPRFWPLGSLPGGFCEEVSGGPMIPLEPSGQPIRLQVPSHNPFCSSNFHSFISCDVHMTLALIPKWEYWN